MNKYLLLESFYDRVLDEDFSEEINYKWSPAEINQILFRNFKNMEKAKDEIINLNPNELYSFNSQ
jgi:hypothetical protein